MSDPISFPSAVIDGTDVYLDGVKVAWPLAESGLLVDPNPFGVAVLTLPVLVDQALICGQNTKSSTGPRIGASSAGAASSGAGVTVSTVAAPGSLADHHVRVDGDFAGLVTEDKYAFRFIAVASSGADSVVLGNHPDLQSAVDAVVGVYRLRKAPS